MANPFDTARFLATSENRVRLLEVMADEPRTRAALHEETGIARATMGRILTDLEARGWIRRDGTRYEATPHGTYLCREFRSLLDTVAALEELDDLVQWFPIRDVTFDLGRLRSARITRSSKQDALKPVTRSLSLIRAADHIRLFITQHAPPAVEAMWEETVSEERQTLELVVSTEFIDTVLAGDPDAAHFLEIVASDRADVYRTQISRAYNCGSSDDTIAFALSDDHGAPQALVETDDSRIQEWFTSFFQTVRQDATRITVDDLSV